MKARLVVHVKNAGFLTRLFSSLLWFIEIFRRTKLNVWIDNLGGEALVLPARSEAYVFEVEPGAHMVRFEDPKRASRARSLALQQGVVRGTLGMAAGLSLGGSLAAGISGASAAVSGMRSGVQSIQNDTVSLTLAEGEEVAITVKPTMKKLKITVRG